MEVDTAQPPPSGSNSSSAPYPPWVFLERCCKSNAVVVDDDSSSPSPAVAETQAAAARTSNGHPIQVSLSLQEPPALSAVRVSLPDGVRPKYCLAVAAHGGALLIELQIERGFDDADAECTTTRTLDHFVYDVGDVAARPPSLLLLPHYFPGEGDHGYWRSYGYGYPYPMNRGLRTHCTGILRRRRRGEGEVDDDDEAVVVVAELMMVAAPASKDVTDAPGTTTAAAVAELFLFASGQWTVKRPRIICYGDDDDELGSSELPSRWTTSTVFPVGDTTLCWVDLSDGGGGGVLLCDALELEAAASPRLRYVPLPTVPSPCCGRNVCATAAGDGNGGGGAIKFVNVYPRCCCGGAGASECQRSRHAYTVNTWTLRIDGGGGAGTEMEWVMDGIVDAAELWSQDIYKGLPRVPLEYPVVSLYEPHVICFVVCQGHHVKFKYGGGDQTIWLLMVDVRSKTIRSVSRHPNYWFSGRELITTNVSYYLNPYETTCSGGGDDGASATTGGQSHSGLMCIEKKEREDNIVTNSMLLMQSPCKSGAETAAAQAQAPSDEILAALREIPSYGLAHDDMLKAYLFLSGDDNGCQVTSLLRLPKNLRKDWLLTKIKEDR